MRYAWLGSLLLCRLLLAAPQDADVNVNARYTVESVILSGKGWTTNLRSETTLPAHLPLKHPIWLQWFTIGVQRASQAL